MKINDINFENLRSTVNKFSQYRVHVVGDTIVDSYTRTSLVGGQTKTPTFSVLYQGQDDYIGGAGIVGPRVLHRYQSGSSNSPRGAAGLRTSTLGGAL